MVRKIVALNERGARIGEDHPRAKLTNHEVDLIRALGEERDASGRRLFGRVKLAAKFEVSRWTIQSILDGESRCQLPMQYKTLRGVNGGESTG